jgi:hypothetical protein
MRKYEALFQHLLRLKRVSLALDAAWATLRRQTHSRARRSRRGHQPLWQVRHEMGHFITNLQVYLQVLFPSHYGSPAKMSSSTVQGRSCSEGCTSLWRLLQTYDVWEILSCMQVDVIETQFAELSSKLESPGMDFKHAEEAHHKFLGSLVEQSFLDMLSVAQALDGIHALCLRLCGLVQVCLKASMPLEGPQDIHFHLGLTSAPNSSKMLQTQGLFGVRSCCLCLVAPMLDHEGVMFCGLQHAEEALQAQESTSGLEGQARAIGAIFRGRSAALFALLQSNALHAPHRTPHLRQLLLRLNYNHFVDSAAAEGGSVADDDAFEAEDVLVVE